ncbi:Low temperature viability protein-domain-containing protein [Gymnopilus junonius]|uniref:Low temperature viability protein-domain-containing protein n=1 Tax=Gymnopilus junonius TaxID=109634 RepID=A0A9P5NYU4_GYMJU|nr:Low temperature viability protein-domain-containing protein [Gymnopilus junonius]
MSPRWWSGKTETALIQHFQLVHRSQRDPLINDPDASVHKNIGEASLYGIYFDDTDYDYMKHLRTVGIQEEGVDSVLIEAPSTSRQKHRNKHNNDIDLLDLPDGVLASTSELPRTYESQQAIPESIAGFRPDMDAHLRQVLEALEDDAFVDDGIEDDFFNELVADGERGSDEEVDFEFTENGIDDSAPASEAVDELSWEQKFANFKKKQAPKDGSDDEYGSEGGDTVGTLPAISVIGGKKRRKSTSDASGYSMSSSSMYRNEALQTLDERFDQMISKDYNDDAENDLDSDDACDSEDEAPELITSRDDFDSMVNTFLNDFEILGRKMKPRLEGESGVEKLDILRRAMGQDDRVRVTNEDEQDIDDDEDKKDRWDCETILTTYTNLENHPRLIRARDSKPVPKIVLDRKTGLPSVLKPSGNSDKGTNRVSFASTSEDTEESDDDEGRERGHTVTRPRDESKEDKKARKAAVKAERQAKRAEKKTLKEQFGAEVKDQKKRLGNKELRLKKL